MKRIQTKNAPAAIGPYEQAIVSRSLVFCSGQIGLNPETGEMVKGVEAQTIQVLKNIAEVLKEAGSSLNHVIKTTIFLTNINDFPKVNELYGAVFTDNKPARSTVGVTALPKGALIEIEVIAEGP